jgi:formate dehydrogenase iron-sulfur subunit
MTRPAILVRRNSHEATWVAPESYVPSIVEWGVSIGLIAATIFLFGLAARLMPVLSRAQPVEGH